ncbi:MAG TPA: PQQ-binding-like beta-propeller repeat protein [Pirellulaceae bacterium]|nr:PQQ-binding-like beta-propeller repeat protein [Pirellulaceae bacterium]HMO91981.1 PQQ-binding-like beta-propeller repeat protein [Pirellulaceae bacterium]HMP68780.1 PQQ-binding-like beta-propeller repeat protein [Pirellulaceae bacterium]
MKRHVMLSLVIFALLVPNLLADDVLKHWHQFRGPTGNGVAPEAKPPIKWSPADAKWKTPIEGIGISTPIIWGDKIFLLSAIQTDRVQDAADADSRQGDAGGDAEQRDQRRGRERAGGGGGGGRQGGRGGGGAAPRNYHQFVVICLDRNTGEQVWKTVVNEAVPHESGHQTNTFASGSPTTDGTHVWASFNSFGVFCLDMEGNVKWERQLGKMRTRAGFGEGASPTLYNDTLIINWDHEDDSFIEAMDALTGETKWKTARQEATTWSTPLVVEHAGRVQVITNGSTRVRSYDFATGELIWECGGQTGNPIPSPMVLDDMAICMTGFRAQAAVAVPLDSQGDVTNSDKLIWSRKDIGAYVPTGVLYQGVIYATKESQGILTSIDAKTGTTIIPQTRLPGIQTLYASLVAANGHVYVTGRDGTTLVIKHGDKFDVVSTNALGEPVDATPAIVDNQIFIRSHQHLYCFENNED